MREVLLDDDIIRLYELGKPRRPENFIAAFFWGDRINISDAPQNNQHVVTLTTRTFNPQTGKFEQNTVQGGLPLTTRFRDTPLLKVRFIDVGQGDGAMIVTPKERVILIDGGEEDHVRRYINAAFSYILRTKPLNCDAIVVTHGDADHFAGLTKLAKAKRTATSPLITADRIYHNGLVKSSAAKDIDAFGQTAKVDSQTYATDLADDLLNVPDVHMNTPFKAWKVALQGLKQQNPNLTIRRLGYGDDSAFDFLQDEQIGVKVLGPIVDDINNAPALRFLKTPGSNSLSASHTINGHSIVLKLTYGNVRFLFGADLNEESEERLLERTRQDNISLAAEVLKVPHHGSADFSPSILEAIRPVVSVVSSGDENATKEYIHPRAGLVGALGKYSR